MTPTDGRSRTTSESKDTTTNGQAAAATNCTAEDNVEVTIFDDDADGGRLPDVVAEIYGAADENEPLESYLAITIQVFIPFLIAGLGMVGAGLVLDVVQVRTKRFFTPIARCHGQFRGDILCRSMSISDIRAAFPATNWMARDDIRK